MTTEQICELELDVAELNHLLNSASRANVKKVIEAEHTKCKANIDLLKKKLSEEEKPAGEAATEKKPAKVTAYTKKISSYAFDGSSVSLANVYITLKDVGTLPRENISCEFKEGSFIFMAKELKGVNYQLQINELNHKIKPEESTLKIGKDDVVIKMKKETKGQTWKFLTRAEQRASDAKEEKYKMDTDKNKDDPSSSIMGLMRKMYDEGDDEMKRTIKKTWYETQNKKGKDGMPGMPDMPGL